MRRIIVRAALAAALTMGAAGTLAAVEKPTTVMHIINVRFKPDAKPEDVKKAIAGIETMANKYPGIKRVWLTPFNVQGGESKFTHVLVMEFESRDSLKKYAGSEAQKEWYKLWLNVRDLSNTHDVTN